MKYYEEILNDIQLFANKIELHSDYFPKLGVNPDLGEPYILVQENSYLYLATERGQEVMRFETSDYDKFLYKVFNSILFRAACDSHRNSSEFDPDDDSDPRLVIFETQQKAMEKLSPMWGKKCKKDNDKDLRDYP